MDKKIINILLVEDDYLDIMNVQREFKKNNITYPLYIAKNGRDALGMLRGEPGCTKIDPLPELVLLDINMPKMNGLEFLQEIRNDAYLKNLRVYVMTTSNEEGDKLSAQNWGVNGYIVKPLSFDDFSKAASSMDSFDLLLDLIKLH